MIDILILYCTAIELMAEAPFVCMVAVGRAVFAYYRAFIALARAAME